MWIFLVLFASISFAMALPLNIVATSDNKERVEAGVQNIIVCEYKEMLTSILDMNRKLEALRKGSTKDTADAFSELIILQQSVFTVCNKTLLDLWQICHPILINTCIHKLTKFCPMIPHIEIQGSVQDLLRFTEIPNTFDTFQTPFWLRKKFIKLNDEILESNSLPQFNLEQMANLSRKAEFILTQLSSTEGEQTFSQNAPMSENTANDSVRSIVRKFASSRKYQQFVVEANGGSRLNSACQKRRRQRNVFTNPSISHGINTLDCRKVQTDDLAVIEQCLNSEATERKCAKIFGKACPSYARKRKKYQRILKSYHSINNVLIPMESYLWIDRLLIPLNETIIHIDDMKMVPLEEALNITFHIHKSKRNHTVTANFQSMEETVADEVLRLLKSEDISSL
ncbi:uncharacterized protein LOC143469240 [Clavelina lepadiformis]|uniref:uncharacterized protein LOC143469240 n=1 Tax=Clavelina lepadiformis TaxID=159417 RepID=UPI0040415D60